MTKSRLIIGISGSSGIIYAIRLLQTLQSTTIETHLVISKAAQLTRAYETSMSAAELRGLADVYHSFHDITAPIASGSYRTMGMIVLPCSMKTLGEIANSIPSNLLTRAADVTLKERRRLVLATREAPLHAAHLENMLKITNMGGIIYPPMPTFYNQPQTMMDLIDDTVGRILDLFEIDCGLVRRWGES